MDLLSTVGSSAAPYGGRFFLLTDGFVGLPAAPRTSLPTTSIRLAAPPGDALER